MATRKRLTKTLFLRICAVGLFICLGTFAVMHSIHNQKKKDSEKIAKQDEDPDVASIVPVVNPEDDKKIATVGGTEEEDRSKSSGGIPKFGSSSSSLQEKDSSSRTRIPPAPRSTSSSLSSSKSAAPPLRPPTKTGSSGGFASGTTGSGNSLLPPRNTTPSRATGGASSGFSATPSTSSNSSFGSDQKLPAFRTTPAPGSSTAKKSSPPKSPIAPLRQPPTSGSGTSSSTSSGFASQSGSPFNDTAKSATNLTQSRTGSTLPGTSTGLPIAPNATNTSAVRPKTQERPFPANSGSRTIPARQVSNGSSTTPRSQTQVVSSPTRVNPAPLRQTPTQTQPRQQPKQPTTQTSPIRNVSNPGTPIRQTQSSLASAPINRSSNVAQPTPGERTLEGVQIPALAVQKIAPREVQVNREATFELIVKNTGKASADNVQVHDFVPEGTRLVETMPPANAGANGQITWNLGSLAPGQQSSIKMKVLPQRAGNIGSVAHVTFGAVASAQTISTQPALSIRHEAPQTVLLGQNLVMTIFVENKGSGAAEDVVLQEDVPEGLEFAGGQKELEYAIGTIPAGQSRRVQLPLRAAKVGQAHNVLIAHGAGDLKATDTVDIRVIAPQLTLRSDGPNRKFLNRKATHTFSLANQGSAAATNVQMMARLPRGLQFVSANNQGQYDRNNHAVVWRLAKLDSQKTGSVELTTVPVAVGQHEIDVQAAADLNQRQQTKQTLAVEQLSELFFDIDDTADAIEVGTGTTYRVRVVNQGQIPAKNVQIQVEFAPAIKPTSVQGNVRNQIQGQNVVLEPIPVLQPNQEISFVVAAEALQAGEHRTIVRVGSDDRNIAVSKEESTHVYSDR